jgi:hypothetical protein
MRRLPFLPCSLEHLPLWLVDVEFADGSRAHLEERFQELTMGTGPAALVKGTVTLGANEVTVTDYWRLVYTAGHHNDTPRPEHWVIFEPAVDVAGVGRARALAVAQGFKGETPQARLLDASFNDLAQLPIVSFVRRKEGDPLPPRFLRGDVDSSGAPNLSDAVRTIRHLFAGVSLACPDAADFDDSGSIELDDAILLLGYLFMGLDPPAAPGPVRCGEDPSTDSLPACDGAACL